MSQDNNGGLSSLETCSFTALSQTRTRVSGDSCFQIFFILRCFLEVQQRYNACVMYYHTNNVDDVDVWKT